MAPLLLCPLESLSLMAHFLPRLPQLWYQRALHQCLVGWWKNKKVGICEFDGSFEGPRYRTSGFSEWPIDGIVYRPKAPQFKDHHRHFHLASDLQCVYGCPPVIRGHHQRGGSRFGCSLLSYPTDVKRSSGSTVGPI